MFWAPDAKVVNSEDLLDEIKALGAKVLSSPRVKKLKKELDKIKAEWTQNQIDLTNVSDVVKKNIYKKINYDERAVSDLIDFVQNTDWGTRNAQGKRSYPMFDDAVLGKIKSCVEKCGGKTKILNRSKDDEQLLIELNQKEYYMSKYSWNNNAVKQKNQFTAPYHFQAERFMTFFDTNYVKPVEDAVQKELKDGTTTKKLEEAVKKNEQDYNKKKDEYENEINTFNSKNGNDDIYTRIFKEVKDCSYSTSGSHKSLIGVYAALKGYDGIYQPNGNGCGHGFVIILNRSKIVTSVE